MRPDSRDLLFDGGGRQIWQVAVCPAGVSSQAEEVVILATFAAAPAVADFAAAAAANQTPLLVVAVPPGTVSGDPAGTQDVLDGLPGSFIDQWLVFAVEEQAFEADLALVVRLGQQAVDLCTAQWLAAVFQGLAGLEAAFLECLAEGGNAPVAGGVLGEGPLDVRRALLIDDHTLDLSAVDAPSGVQVANWCYPGCATAADLFLQALLGFC